MAQGWGRPGRASARRGTVSTDPGSARGTLPTPTIGYGTCGHLIAVHNISETTGRRTSCTHAGPEGQCPCKGCEPAPEVGQ